MNKTEVLLVVVGLLLLALATVLSMAHSNVADCLYLLTGGCQEVGFAYEGGGKLALLFGFVLFLVAALHGLLRNSDDGRQ